MAARRKIMENPTNDARVAPFCSIQCDPQQNPTGFCITTCFIICPSFCRTVDLSPSPSSPPLATLYFPSPPPKHHHLPLTLPLKVSLIATISLFLLYTLCKFYTIWYRSRRLRTPPPEPSPENQETHDAFLDHDVIDHPIWYIRTIGLPPAAISAIAVVEYRKDEGLIEGTDCSVCLTAFQEDDSLRLLPKCNHAFHISCIDTWLRSHTNCPLCRAGIVKNPVNSPSPEQNIDDLGSAEETHTSIPIFEEDNNEEENVSFENCDFLIMRRSASFDNRANSIISSDIANCNNLDGDLGIELVKVDQTTENKFLNTEGDNQNQNF